MGMALAFYISHPEVLIDPAIPVPQWSLSAVGRARLVSVAGEPWVRSISRIVSSDETKAIETAAVLADGTAVEIRTDMGENDRSATGFLPPPAFEVTANAFFADPAASIRGWERAIDAQARIVRAVTAVLDALDPLRSIAFSGHGGVGTLLYCAFAGLPIDRRHDQSRGGCVITIDIATRQPLFGWVPLEAVSEKLRAVGLSL